VANDLGGIRGWIELDVKEAIKAYTEVRQHHLSAVSALNSGAGAIAAVSAGFVTAGAGMAAGIMVAVNAAAEFERKLDFFTAVSGATQKEYDKIREKALQLGADTIYSADQIADSFVELAKSGVETQDILNGIGDAVANLGAATDIPLAQAATSLTTILNTFNLSAEDAVDVVDKLAGAANASSIDVGDLITTMTYAGASAKTAGISFEDVNTAIALLGENGIKGSKAGTGLRQMFDKLIAPTRTGKEALKELGIILDDGTNSLLDASGALKPIPQLLDMLNGPLSQLSVDKKMDILGQIFPITSLPTILNLLNEGSAGLARLNAEIGKTTALDIASERLDNLSGDIEILKGNLQTLVINIGSTQQAFARGLVQSIQAVVDWLNSLDSSTLGLITTTAAVVAGMLIFIGVAGLFAGSLLNIISLAIRLNDAMLFLGKTIPIVAFAWARLKAVMLFPGTPIIALLLAIAAALAFFFTQTETGKGVWAQLMAVFNQAMAVVLPMLQQFAELLGGWLTTALAAVGPLLTQLAGTFSGWFASALQVVIPLLQIIGDFLMAVIAPVLPIITQLLAGLGAAFAGVGTDATGLQGIMNIFAGLAAAMVNIIPVILTTVVQLITLILQVIVAAAPLLLTAFLTTLTSLVTALTAILPTIIAALTQVITTILVALVSMLPMILTAAIQLFTGIVMAITTVLPMIITTLITAITAILTALIQALPLLLNAAVQFFLAIVQAIPVILPPLITAVVGMIPMVLAALLAMIPLVIEAAINLFMAIVEAIPEIIPPLIEAVIGLLPILISTVIGLIPALIQAAIQLFLALVMAIPKIIPPLIGAILGMVPVLVSTIIGIIPQLINAAVQLFMGIVEAIPQVIPAIVGALVSMGRQMIEGLVSGVTAMAKRVIGAIQDVVGGAIDFAKNLLNINSPSKVFRDIGVNTIMGMVVGMEKTAPQLERTFGVISDSLDSFYDQVYAAREMDMMLNLQTQMDPLNMGLQGQLAALTDLMTDIAEKDTFNIEKLEVTKEEGENLDVSLPNAIRKTAYMVG
jgi:TP901 family phage tail tape measure protein